MPAPALGTSTVTVSTSAGGLAAIRDEWRGLAEAEGNPYLTPEWLDACLSRGESPVVISVRSRDGALGGLLPWSGAAADRCAICISPGDDLGDTYTMLVAPAADPDHVAGLAGRALRAIRGALGHDHPRVRGPRGPVAAQLHGRGLGAVTTLVRSAVVRPYIDLTVGSWDGFLAALKRTDRKETRRRERRAIEAGATYRLVEAPEDVDAGMRELFRLHDLRWSGDEASSVASAPIRRFLVEFAAAAAPRMAAPVAHRDRGAAAGGRARLVHRSAPAPLPGRIRPGERRARPRPGGLQPRVGGGDRRRGDRGGSRDGGERLQTPLRPAPAHRLARRRGTPPAPDAARARGRVLGAASAEERVIRAEDGPAQAPAPELRARRALRA